VALWLALGMALTRSRIAWLAAAVFVVGWAWARARIGARLSPRSLLAWTVLFGAIVAVIGPLSDAVNIHAPESVADRLQSGGGRLRIWATLVEGLMQSPWVGYGWSQVSRAALAGSLNHFTGESMLRQSHSVPLDLMVWTGVPLGLLLIGIIVLWWVRHMMRCDSAERAVVFTAVSLILLYSSIEFPLESFFFLVPFGLLTGALEAWSPASPLSHAPRAAFALVLGAIAALGFAVGVEYLDVEQASRDGRLAAAGYGPTRPLPAPVLLDEPIEYIRFWRTQARPGMSVDELDWMRRIAGRNPAPPTLLRYAVATGLNGQSEVAAQALIRLCNMHRAKRCDDGRKSWAQLQQSFPVLSTVPYPPTPKPP
jgi:Virulence factor membrane-bound polymerase, C-terminal/O-Antigen ligase